MRRSRILSGIVALFTIIFVGVAFLFVAGTLRYGGTEGLVRRVRAEVSSLRPHPDYVPTPLAGKAVALSDMLGRPEPMAESVAPSGVPRTSEPTDTPMAPTEIEVQGPSGSGAPTSRPENVEPTPTPAYRAALPQVHLSGLTHMWQTWNNCGPATLAMYLSYYGSTLGQADVAAALRPFDDDKNVSPEELASYARSQGFQAVVRANGDADRLRLLLSNDIPVIVETWHEPAPNDGMGHYRLLVGYDDEAREWIVYDSYESKGIDHSAPYAGIRISYDDLDALWPVFNRVYLLVFTDTHIPAVAGILGPDADDRAMWERALVEAQAAVTARPDDPFAWFNLGTDLVALRRYDEAAGVYDHARQIGLPWRMLWYQFGPFKAYYETGRHDEVIALADATLKVTDTIEELYYWKGMAFQAQGDLEAARAAWQRALELNRNYGDAAAALAALE